MRISGRRMRKPWHYRRDCDSWRTACQQQSHENDAENFRPCAPLSASRPALVADDDRKETNTSESSSPVLPYFQFQLQHRLLIHNPPDHAGSGVGRWPPCIYNVWGRVEEVVVHRCRGERAVVFVPRILATSNFRFGGGRPAKAGRDQCEVCDDHLSSKAQARTLCEVLSEATLRAHLLPF